MAALEDLHEQLAEAVAVKEQLREAKRELDKVKTLLRDTERQRKDLERRLKGALAKGKARLTSEHEDWLFQRNASVFYDRTMTGKLKIKLKTGRFSGNGVEMLFDHDDRKARPLREVIEMAQAQGR